jgi:two-component system LytT family response regulator
MNPIRALIVDDEPLARQRISRMLRTAAEIELIGECTNGEQAVEAVLEQSPDLMFLDVQMPEMDGFEVLKALGNEKIPYVIFVTAYDQYALRAFEVFALDYLLKPFNEKRLQKAVQRAKEQIEKERTSHLATGISDLLRELRSKAKYLDRLLLKEEGRARLVKTQQIDWIEADGKYIRLHIGKESHLMRESLTQLESRLDPQHFLRIHRSTIVNLNRIKEVQVWFYGEYRILLHDGTALMLSRTYRKKFHETVGQSQ